MSAHAIEAVFVSVGTTQFDALVSAIVAPEFLRGLAAVGVRRLVVQAGRSVDLPAAAAFGGEGRTCEGVHVLAYPIKPSTAADIAAADVVICHAGAGSLFDALRGGKRTITVVNTALMDNHQEELARAMDGAGHVVRAADATGAALLEALADPRLRSLTPLPAPALPALLSMLDEDLGFSA